MSSPFLLIRIIKQLDLHGKYHAFYHYAMMWKLNYTTSSQNPSFVSRFAWLFVASLELPDKYHMHFGLTWDLIPTKSRAQLHKRS